MRLSRFAARFGAFAVHHGRLQGDAIGHPPFRLHPDVALGGVDDARALRRLERRRAEERLERKRHAKLSHRPTPAIVTHLDPEIGGERVRGDAGGVAGAPSVRISTCRAIRRPRVDGAFDREARAPQDKCGRVTSGLKPRLQVAGELWSGGDRGGCLRRDQGGDAGRQHDGGEEMAHTHQF